MGTSGTHSEKQRTISIGILTAERVEFVLGGQTFLAVAEDGMVMIGGEVREEWYFIAGGQGADCQRLPENSSYCPRGSDVQQSADIQAVLLRGASYFTLKNVEIGKGFHWQRYQDQSFPGDLRLIARDGKVIAINVVGIEDYLQCVIASEMSPSAGFEFLKAHAVISRSWLLAQLDKRDELQRMVAAGKGCEGRSRYAACKGVESQSFSAAGKGDGVYSSVECDTPGELIRWQDREDHKWFDFCADDHCQRYQGIPQLRTPIATTDESGRLIPSNPHRVIPSTVEGSRHQAIAEGVRESPQNSQPVAAGFGAAPQYIGEGSRHQAIAEAEGSPLAVDPEMIRKTRKVIEATWGQVLSYGGRVCDARFSKCCGGALEEFKYCWENKEVPYLKYARDYEPVVNVSGDPAASGKSALKNEQSGAGDGGFGAKSPEGRPAKAGSIAAYASVVDLREEKAARKWILGSPRAFCNTRSARLLGQVLKDYDSETKDFYRWTVEYPAEELRQIILERTGDDYGRILDLIPLERGVSGRICRLKIVGSKKTKIIGKELEIRKTLSRSHLYSSAFVVEKVCDGDACGNLADNEQDTKSGDAAVSHHRFRQRADSQCVIRKPDSCASCGDGQVRGAAPGNVVPGNGAPAKFILHGAGWGHGVGLCQIGAAAMGARGYEYRDILQHYYPGSTISTLYGKE